MLGKLKSLVWEDDPKQAAAKPAAPTGSAPLGAAPVAAAPGVAAPVDDKFVQALRTAIKNRPTAFTALLAAADKLASIIPDSNTRLKAAYATVAGEGRDVRTILGAIEVHAADLESQRMAFTKQAEDAARAAIGAKQAELDSIDPSIASAQSQIESLTRQIQSLNDTIAQKSARKAELTADIANENARFAGAKSQFETALTIVKSELDGQKAIIQSALS